MDSMQPRLAFLKQSKPQSSQSLQAAKQQPWHALHRTSGKPWVALPVRCHRPCHRGTHQQVPHVHGLCPKGLLEPNLNLLKPKFNLPEHPWSIRR